MAKRRKDSKMPKRRTETQAVFHLVIFLFLPLVVIFFFVLRLAILLSVLRLAILLSVLRLAILLSVFRLAILLSVIRLGFYPSLGHFIICSTLVPYDFFKKRIHCL
jgi:hypothetical protein